MLSGWKKATITDGTTTVTLSKLIPAGCKYRKESVYQRDIDGNQIVIEEKASINLLTTDVDDIVQLRNWMINKTDITQITVTGFDEQIQWSENSKIIVKHVLSGRVGGRSMLQITAQLRKESLSSISVVSIAS